MHISNLKEVLGERDREKPGAASHSSEVEAHDVASELVVVHNHGRERRGGIEKAAIHDQDPDVFGLHRSLGKELVNGAEHDGLGFLAGLAHRGVRRGVENRLREVSRVAEAGSLEDLLLELEVLLGERPGEPGLVHEDLLSALSGLVGLVAGKVNEVDGPGTSQEIQGAQEHEQGRANDDRDEVESQVLPQIVEVLQGKRRRVSEEDDQTKRNEEHSESAQGMVSELHVLQFHRVFVVR